ncbi:uncharacterized protein LOC110818947 [Carica papaya]|uniref:uncharacterized protein LOC110818947 n=1 Tax=Carica papaya TaxID=3649 RepID=UPI000B8C6E61|nr:uncharacterized protein LOC110818947 [Carica papaya]
MDDLRERYFGPTFELMSHDKYVEIWDLDERDPFLPLEGGESVDNVASRLAGAVETMESEYEGCAILVISHGDPLQILQTIMLAAKRHKEEICELASRFRKTRVRDVLSEHRKFAMLTGQLVPII